MLRLHVRLFDTFLFFEVVRILVFHFVPLVPSSLFFLLCCMCVLFVRLFPSYVTHPLCASLCTHSHTCRTYLSILGCSSPRVTIPNYLLPFDLFPVHGSVNLLEQRRSVAIMDAAMRLGTPWEVRRTCDTMYS